MSPYFGHHVIAVDCIGQWTDSTACSVSCGTGGTLTQAFNITLEAQNGGYCEASSMETRSTTCDGGPCRIYIYLLGFTLRQLIYVALVLFQFLSTHILRTYAISFFLSWRLYWALEQRHGLFGELCRRRLSRRDDCANVPRGL